MLGIVGKLATRDGEAPMACAGAPLAAVRHERRDRNAHRYAGAAMIAIRSVRERTAAAEAQPDELAVHACVDQMARGGDLRARSAIRKIAARIRRRRVELQRRERKVV